MSKKAAGHRIASGACPEAGCCTERPGIWYAYDKYPDKQSIIDEEPQSFVSYIKIHAGVRRQESAKACTTIPANPQDWLNTHILQGQSIHAYRQHASDARRTSIRMTGSVHGGFQQNKKTHQGAD